MTPPQHSIGGRTVEPSAEGIPLVFGDGKYPHDPPRVASDFEAALWDERGRLLAALERIAAMHMTPEGHPAEQARIAREALEHAEAVVSSEEGKANG